MAPDRQFSIARVVSILLFVGLVFAGYYLIKSGSIDLSDVDWRFEFQRSRFFLLLSGAIGIVLFGILLVFRRPRGDARVFVWTFIIMLFFVPALIASPGGGSKAGFAIAPGWFGLIAAVLIPYEWVFLIPNILLGIVLHQVLRRMLCRRGAPLQRG